MQQLALMDSGIGGGDDEWWTSGAEGVMTPS